MNKPLSAVPVRPPAALAWLAAFLHVVCPLLFFTDLTRNPYFTQICLLQGGLCLALALFGGAALARGGFPRVRSPFDGPLLVLLGWAAVTWALSWWAHPSLRLPIWNEGKRMHFFLLTNGLLAYWLAAQVEDAAWRARFRRLLLGVGAAAAGYGVLQYMGKDFIWASVLNPYSGRPVSTFGNPNFLSSYLVMLLPAALEEGVLARSSRGRWLAGGTFLLLTSGIVCTMTRSSWIGAAAAVGVYAWLNRAALAPRRRWLTVLFAAAALLIAFWPSSPLAGKSMRPTDRVRELIAGVTEHKAYGSWHQRLMIWSCALDMVRDRPLAGKGMGAFELFYPFYQGRYLSDEIYRTFRTHANNAHNVVMEIWSQTGTVGLGLSAWILLLAAALWRRRNRALAEPDRRQAAVCLAAGAGMLTDNFFGNVSLFFAVPAFLFAWTMGSLGRSLAGGETEARSVRGAAARAAWVLAVLLAGGGMVYCWRQWKAEVHYFDGFKKAKRGDMRGAIEATEASHGYRRWEVNNNYELANAYARLARWSAENNLPGEAAELSRKSLWAYDEAIAANAGYDEIHFNRSTVLAQAGRIDEAMLGYRTAILINPLSLDAYKALGSLYVAKPELHEKAAELYERALFFFPRDKDLWNNLGYARTKLKDYEKAAEAYARALRLDLRFDIAAKNLQVSLAALGRKEHPLLKLPALLQQVQSAAGRQDWAGAVSRAEEAIALAPENLELRIMLGDLRYRQGRPEDAAAAYEAARELDPRGRAPRLALARLGIELNRRDRAAPLLRELYAEDPADKDVEELLRRIGETPVAPPPAE